MSAIVTTDGCRGRARATDGPVCLLLASAGLVGRGMLLGGSMAAAAAAAEA
jgi:hypothetical protein